MYRKAVAEIWSRFKNQFWVPRYADLPRNQLTDAILYANALELRCAKQLEDDGNPPLPPFLHGKIGERFLIRLKAVAATASSIWVSSKSCRSRPSDRH